MNPLTNWTEVELNTERRTLLDALRVIGATGATVNDPRARKLLNELEPVRLELSRRDTYSGLAGALTELTDAGIDYSRALVMMNAD